ncbi:DedA family protein [Dactylosporangium sp. CA-139114]|uniref:DedA family protein n=1 Tax=Dactylosporangium sp. CA-139114 TaxID=3239931 RepID=UPI003D97949F
MLDLVSAPGVLYATVLVLLTIDAFIPVVPAQALMIGGGILSASGHVQLLLLVLSGAAGVIAGDLLAFAVGRRLARRGERRRRELPRRAAKVTARLNEAMQRHVFLAVLFCRFVPAGRMVTALYAGRNGVSTRRFATYDVVAGTLWATYGALLGHFGGEAMADSSWLPLLLIAAATLLFVAGAPLLGLAGRLNKGKVITEPALLPQPATAAPAAVTTLGEPAALIALGRPAAGAALHEPGALLALGQTAAGAALDEPAVLLALGQTAAGAAPDEPAAEVPAQVTRGTQRPAAQPLGLVNRLRRRNASPGPEAAAPRRQRICRRSAMETLAAVEPLAAIEVMAAAEAVAAAESVVVQVNGLESAAQ